MHRFGLSARFVSLYVASVRGILPLVMVLGASLVGSAPARAFCRTTTSVAPQGYDPAVSGCWTQGMALAWPSDRVPYAVGVAASKRIPLADVMHVADLAFNAWNGVLCGGEPPSIQAYDDGPTYVPDGSEGDALAGWASCSDTACDPAAHDVIVFDDDVWPYSDPVNTLALTTVTYGVDDGHILEAYTEVNTVQHQVTTAEPPPDGTIDLQAILTHEAGHFLGLAHATDTKPVMYAFYQPGAIQLTSDDVDGLCAAYPPARAGGACTTSSARPDGIAAAGLSVAILVGLGALRRRRRAGARLTR